MISTSIDAVCSKQFDFYHCLAILMDEDRCKCRKSG